MPCLTESPHQGTVTWIGTVPDRSGTPIRATPAQTATADFAGLAGEAHAGLTRPACIRVRMLHDKGTEIRNTRQLSILSVEENGQIAAALGLEKLDPAWLGASLELRGIPDLSHLPPGSRLQNDDGLTITVDLENGPCNWPGVEIDADRPGHGKGFKRAAENRRGVTAWIERPGSVSIGDVFRLFVPTQPQWAPE